jgi:hypothetical protein
MAFEVTLTQLNAIGLAMLTAAHSTRVLPATAAEIRDSATSLRQSFTRLLDGYAAETMIVQDRFVSAQKHYRRV